MRYQVTTGLMPHEALATAMTHFGSQGLGLTVTSQTSLGLVFQGGGGHVVIALQPGDETILELETREWDYAVQQFMKQVSGRRRWWQRLLRRRRRPQPALKSDVESFTILNNNRN